tara:strand:+ start:13997 stop:14488 length:492 start_codon:yes stop_codon:yes gene_type:complete
MARKPSKSKSKTKVPKKYTAGLSDEDKKKREAQIRRRAKASRSGKPNYGPMAGDKAAKTKPSKYTQQAKRSGLKKKIEENMNGKGKEAYIKAVSKATGYPLPILREVHERGARAFATGRRPGASQSAWSRARVLSFVQGGKTSKTADKELYKKAKEQMKKRKK